MGKGLMRMGGGVGVGAAAGDAFGADASVTRSSIAGEAATPRRGGQEAGRSQHYKPRSAGLINPYDYKTGDFGAWSSLFKPSGYVDYRKRIGQLPLAYRPMSGFYVAFRKGSGLDQALSQALVELGPQELSDAGVCEVYLEGKHPERFSSLLTLIHCGLFNARFAVPTFIETPGGRDKDHINLVHRIAISGREPSPGQPGLSLKERFQGLREAGESLNFPNRQGFTPLHFAARYSNAETVAALIDRRVNVNLQCKSGFTPLMLAASHASPEVVALLLRTRADRNRRCLDGQLSALHLAVQRGGPEGCRIARMLIENGAIPGIQDSEARTPLHEAVLRNDEEMARTLLGALSSGWAVRPNWADRWGETPLHIASRIGNESMVRLLLEHGAHPNLADRADRTALAAAHRAGAPSAVIVALRSARGIVNQSV